MNSPSLLLATALAGLSFHAMAGGVSLAESLHPSPVKPLAAGSVTISGTADGKGIETVQVRVTSSVGKTSSAKVAVHEGRFACRFPADFAGADNLSPSVLYVDATDAPQFGGVDSLGHEAEASLVVADVGGALPDLPMVFMDDLIDSSGRKDAASAQWERTRALVNHFMQSRAAKLMKMQRPDFDLAKPRDLSWFKDRATLYDFAHRDRDWSQPLGNRVARGFWNAVWPTWFNPSNDHPWDGDASNRAQSNFRPYTFANDPADLLVLYQMLRGAAACVQDNRRDLADGVLANLLAMQHRTSENFAIAEASGQQEHYTAGAFRYGMFNTGEWLTEGKGWFVNPTFRDFVRGGVFNGRALWALGESLKADPQGPRASSIREAIALTLRFCLHDGLERKYTVLTKSGLPVWNRTAGEHAYLLLGMLAACEVEPAMEVRLEDSKPARPLRSVTVDALNALAESAGPDGNWTHYGNATAMNIAALAEGARVLANEEGASRWKAAAMKTADVWLALKVPPTERALPTPMFGHMTKEGAMTFHQGKDEHSHVSLYIGGHWLHALSVLHTVTHEQRYADRANAILAYYCGDNALRVRLLNELGAVNNRLTDADGDGIEDTMNWDGYPESTAFMQIGVLKLLAPGVPPLGKIDNEQ